MRVHSHRDKQQTRCIFQIVTTINALRRTKVRLGISNWSIVAINRPSAMVLELGYFHTRERNLKESYCEIPSTARTHCELAHAPTDSLRAHEFAQN